jgi:predicted nucleic acid-binding protein
MHRIIVSDTSCLILLDTLGRISLLKSLFGKITITKIVAEEFGKVLPEFVEIENPKDNKYQKILETFLDPGEASAMALALEKEECLLIIDEFKGRREARQLGLNYTGTMGILIVAKEKGLISSVTEIIKEIGKTNFRISDKLLKEIKKKSGE